jgi:hypothetical protein
MRQRNVAVIIAAACISVALCVFGYFQYRARQIEQEEFRAFAPLMNEALKAQNRYWQTP